MLTEPDLNKPGLQVMLRDAYGLDISRLTFVPRGLASFGYVGEGQSEARAFVKVYDPEHVEPTAVVDPAYALPLIWKLYHDGNFRHLPCPIRALDGAFVTQFERYNVVVLTYLAGRPFDDIPDWGQTLRDTLARVVGAFHRSTGSIQVGTSRVERFDIAYVSQLQDVLFALESLGSDGSPTQLALRELLFPKREVLDAGIARLSTLSEKARGLGQPMVLCHTDLWAGNLLLGEDDEVYILDWDDIRLAPPEQDLFFYVLDPTGEQFLDAYEQVFGQAALSADTLGYYLYRRTLDDIIAFAAQLLADKDDETATRAALGWLSGNLAELGQLEPRIADAHAMLARRGQLDGPQPS